MTVTITQERITPERAKTLLATNTKNRHMRPTLVYRFRRDIEAGRWQLNGETIKLDEEGNLLDGQHRLKAIIDSKIPVDTFIASGVVGVAQETVDTGASRTFGDILRLRGESHYAALAAMVRLSWLIDTGGKPTAGGTLIPSFGALSAYLDKNPELRTIAPVAVRGPQSAVRLPASLVGALMYQMQRIDHALGEEFWRQIFENDAKKGSAVFVLREQLIKDTRMAHRMSVPYRAAIINKAWNMWLEGREPSYISWKPSEDFPLPRGPRVDEE